MSCLSWSGAWELKKDEVCLRPTSLVGSLPPSCRERNQIPLMEAGSLQASTHIFLTW